MPQPRRFAAGDRAGGCQNPRADDLLSSLVDKSLVMKDDLNGLALYRLHETMCEYAHVRLREVGEEDPLEERYADYYISRCRRSAEGARNRLVPWLEWMDVEIDNVRTVLRRCVVHDDTSRGVDLATSLGWYGITRATTEGARWLDELLRSEGGRPQARVWAWHQDRSQGVSWRSRNWSLTHQQADWRAAVHLRTNRQKHVRNILNKMGFDSRTQLAGWMASSDGRRHQS